MKKPDNIMLPLALAPLVAAICFVMFDTLFGTGIKHYDGFWEILDSIIFGILFFYVYSLFFSFTIGLVSFYLARYIWKITWYTALIGGFIDGIIGAPMVSYNAVFAEFNLNFILTYAIYGAITGLAFWVIWKRGSQ